MLHRTPQPADGQALAAAAVVRLSLSVFPTQVAREPASLPARLAREPSPVPTRSRAQDRLVSRRFDSGNHPGVARHRGTGRRARRAPLSAACGGCRGGGASRRLGSTPKARREPRTGERSAGSRDRCRMRPFECRPDRRGLGCGQTATSHSRRRTISTPPRSGFQTRSLSSPATIRNVPGAGWAFADAAAPLRRGQRLQRQ